MKLPAWVAVPLMRPAADRPKPGGNRQVWLKSDETLAGIEAALSREESV